MNKSIFSILVCGGLIFSAFTTASQVQAQGFSFPAEMNKSFTPLSIEPGGTARLLVTVYNPNAFNLTNARWTDNLAGVQPGILLANPVNASNSCGGTVTAQPGGTVLSLSGGTVPAQVGSTPGSCTVSVDVTSTTPFNLINTIPAGALQSNGGGGTITNTSPASATLHVGVVRGPTLNKRFSPNTILVGQTSQMMIVIRNNNLDSSLTQASLQDALPAGLALANPVSPSLSGCGDSASLTAASGGSSLVLNNATIPAGSTCSIQVDVTSVKSGIYSNILPAGALKTQQNVTNEAPASASLNVQDIGLTKSFSPPEFPAGKTSTLTITLRNSTGSPYTGVTLSDNLPGTVLTVVPGSAATTCGGTVTLSPPRTVSLAGGTVPSGTPASPGSCTVSFQVTAPADASSGDYKNTIPVGALTTDQGITNGLSASDWVRILPVGAGIDASKSFTPATISVGENSRLRINIPAPLDTDLTNFSLVDNLPAEVTVSNSSPATYTNCGASAILTAATGAASVTLSNGTIPAGTICQINLYVTSNTTGVHTNVIRPTDISNTENRTIPGEVSADLRVQAMSVFRISKSFTPPQVSPGGISTLTITLENRNTVPLVDASVTDPLPGDTANGILVASTPNASTTCAGGVVTAGPGTQTITMTGGTVPAMVNNVPGVCTVTVDVQGMGEMTTRTNIIPVTNASARPEGTNTVLDPTQPAQADLVIGELNIGVVKGFDPLTVFGGAASTLSIQLLNSNNVPVEGLSFDDNMPAGMVVADPPEASVGDCGGTVNATAGQSSFTYRGGSLPAGASCFVKLKVTMTVNGNLTNILPANSLTTSSGVSNPRPAEATLTNLPGASISKAFSSHSIAPGGTSLLTFTIRNTGTVALSGMGFKDVLPGDLPVGLEIAGTPAPVNTCGGTFTAVEGTQLIQLVDGALNFGSSCTLTVTVTGRVAGTFTNTIEAGQLTSNEGATNHEATTDTVVVTGENPGGGGNGNGGGNNKGSDKNKKKPGQSVGGFEIPVTGFAPNVRTPLNPVSRPRYDATDIRIQIPAIGVDAPIVGVQIRNGSWDVSWLQDGVGWLNGTAFPTWEGNSVLLAHVVKADGKTGPFAKLKTLHAGEPLYILYAGYRYTFQVESNRYVAPEDVSVLGHLEAAYLTLITCDGYDVASNTYLQRVAVRAKLVDVKPAP